MSATTDHKHLQRTFAEKLQFRFLLSVAFIWFFFGAVLCRLTRQPITNALPGESCFQSARRAAYSLIPYVFMRI